MKGPCVLTTNAAARLLLVLPVLLAPCSCTRSWSEQREQMVHQQIEARGVRDPRVLEAMRTVPRHRFLTEDVQADAYQDLALPIGAGQTTPAPYVVALMTELLGAGPGSRVLEIGTGLGYHSAVLAATGAEVFTIEIQPQLCHRAARLLEELGYGTVTVRCGNGLLGWPEEAPFDAILVTGSHLQVPEELLSQLRDGGRLVMPIGDFYQEIRVFTRQGDQISERAVIAVRFPPLDDRP